MVLIRFCEESLVEPILDGSVRCPVHLNSGEEAVAVGICAALDVSDYIFGNHRSHGHFIAKGGKANEMVAEIFGKETGCSRGRGGSMHIIDPEKGMLGSAPIVAGTISLALGAALASKIRKEKRVSVSFFGDGATGEGVLYESMNFAALKNLTIIFVCENNLYATHMPIDSCLADPEIHRKAEIFNMPGVMVDGNDVTKVFKMAGKVIESARHGQGPALIECMTYRWLGHVGPDDDLDKGLRSREELEHWKKRCPIRIAEKMLIKQGVLSETEKARFSRDIENEVTEALAFARQSPFPAEDELLDNVFSL